MNGLAGNQRDVEDLMSAIRDATRAHRVEADLPSGASSAVLRLPADRWRILGLLAQAEHGARVRTELPRQLNRFPFNRSGVLRGWFLRLFELLFRDQRRVNLNLLEAVRELAACNDDLRREVTTLRKQLDGASAGPITPTGGESTGTPS